MESTSIVVSIIIMKFLEIKAENIKRCNFGVCIKVLKRVITYAIINFTTSLQGQFLTFFLDQENSLKLGPIVGLFCLLVTLFRRLK